MLKAKFWISQVRTYQKVNILPREKRFVYVYVTFSMVLLYLFAACGFQI